MSGHRWFALLLAFTLSGVVGQSHAQTPQLYVVVYVEFQPGEANHGKKLVDELAQDSLTSPGVVNFSSVREIGRANRFALVERWGSAEAYEAYKASTTWTMFLADAQPMLAAPLDERPGVLLSVRP